MITFHNDDSKGRNKENVSKASMMHAQIDVLNFKVKNFINAFFVKNMKHGVSQKSQ